MLTISDSTALKILNESCLIAGVGNEIRVIAGDSKCTLPFQLKGKIHGIESEEYSSRILIFGEYEFILVERVECSFALLYRGSLSDWISSGKVLRDDDAFVLVTAHSVALFLKYDADTKSCRVEVKSSCTDKSTLYCSYVCGSTWSDCVLMGGNAFGEVLIWQPSRSTADVTKAELLHRIPGHNGVVFSIDVDLDAKLMVTTSDDRSIRCWDISLHKSSDERVDFKKSTFMPRKSGYSHIARVFKGKIVHEGGETYAITGGEDSFICLWNRNCELLFKRRQQFGATIWNLDYHSPTKTVFTAGSSGNITKYSLRHHFLKEPKNKSTMLTSDILDSSEYMAKVKFLNANHLIGITSKNRLMHKNTRLTDDWTVIENFSSYKCTVLEVYNAFIAIAGYQNLSIYKFDDELASVDQIYHGSVLPGVIRSIIFLTSSEFLISDELGNCKLCRLFQFDETLTVDLPSCKERWITSGCKVNDEFLVVSNRQGSLLLFAITSDFSSLKLCDTLKRLHGHLGATTISLVRDTPSYSILKTTGHDGAIRTIKLDKINQCLTAICRELIPISWVERRALCTESNNELLFGFNDNHFVLWSRDNDVHFEISCGGGHRCWDLQLDLQRNQVSIVFIKKKQVLLHQEMVFNKSSMTINIPLNKWHVKPCNKVAVIQNQEKIYLISGGDDNLLKISQFQSRNGNLEELFEIHSHISNIRAISTWTIISGKYYLFSAGGRAQICVSLFDDTLHMIEELVDYSVQKEKPSNDIRFDPETRIMAIDIHQAPNGLFEIYAGCSDGYLRKFTMNEAFRINLVREVFYGRCILQVRVIADLVLTSSTDGTICFWKLDLSRTSFQVVHHESGVNSFDVRFDNGVFHLLTGGDDQQVVYSTVILESGKLIIKNMRKMDHLHSAQVTAVCFSPNLRTFYTSSIDQVVRQMDLDTFETRWQRLSCVADVKGINIVQDESNSTIALLYGCGLQAFDTPSSTL